MWETQMIETDRGTFEVFVKGEGKPLCVTHLYSEYDARGYQFADCFTEYFQVWLVNLRGCGRSASVAPYTYSLFDTIADLEAIRMALGYEKWAFAGHSTGGMLALQYAIALPESLAFIVGGGLSASKAYASHPQSIYCRSNPKYDRIQEIFAKLAEPYTTLPERQALLKEWLLASMYNQYAYDQMIMRPDSGKTHAARLAYFMEHEFPTFDLRTQLRDVTLPSYIYAGKYDTQCPHEFGMEAAVMLGNATFTTFKRSGHFPFWEEEEAFLDFVTHIATQQATALR